MYFPDWKAIDGEGNRDRAEHASDIGRFLNPGRTNDLPELAIP